MKISHATSLIFNQIKAKEISNGILDYYAQYELTVNALDHAVGGHIDIDGVILKGRSITDPEYKSININTGPC